MPVKPLPKDPSLENLRKQAKTLLTQVRAGETAALALVREFHPDDAWADIALAGAQLVIARSYGFPSWTKLKQYLTVIADYNWSPPKDAPVLDNRDARIDAFVDLACLSYGQDWTERRVQARELLAADPSLASANIYTAATVGDFAAIERMLADDPSLARRRGGPRNWEPLLYACYSRLDSTAEDHSTLEAARLLLQHGADPNAGFLWERDYLFTALTGAFGEGERGPVNQPQHQYAQALARLLLEAGADPNDGQSLYNRMFRPGNEHLELLFEFGLGRGGDGVWFRRMGGRADTPAKMLRYQLGWAVEHGLFDRVKLLVEHGADVTQPDPRRHRTPYELAALSGHHQIAEYLAEHGAPRAELNELDAFAIACFGADDVRARALLTKNPTLITQLGRRRSELMGHAAAANQPAAIRLMVDLGFDINEVQRTAPLHSAASAGQLEMVKLLIELGADPLIRDTEFNGTPHGWANYGYQFGEHNREGCRAVMDYLAQYEPAATD
jgi:ankyrin repeat protein